MSLIRFAGPVTRRTDGRPTSLLLAMLAASLVVACAGSASAPASEPPSVQPTPTAASPSPSSPTIPPASQPPTPPPGPTRPATAAASASASATPPLSIVGIGDSIADGTFCSCRPYVALYGDLASKALGRPAAVTQLATSDDLQSGELLHRVQSIYSTQLAGADIVTVTIGNNDWAAGCNWPKDDACWTAGAAQVGKNLDAILNEILKLRSGKPTAIRVTTYYNYLIDDPNAPADPAFQAFFATELRKFNAILCSAAKAHGAICVDLVPSFNGPTGTQAATTYLNESHIHLNEGGHRLVAMALAAAGYAPFP